MTEEDTAGSHALEKDGFRARGLHFSRVDAFSDVVFGFALTLLVVSLEVPRTFAELHESLRSFLPFGVCFFFLMLIWRAHYRFFRRYGLHDTRTLVLNAALLFVILFYVYPLKFLFTFAVFSLFGWQHAEPQRPHQVMELMILFSLGYAAVYALLTALYQNALRQRHGLSLTPVEVVLTRGYLRTMLSITVIGLLSCGVALLIEHFAQGYAGYAGLTYFLLALVQPLLRRRTRRQLAAVDAAS